jgi:hypothetical protein
MPGRIEREVVANLLIWYPQRRTVVDLVCAIYQIPEWQDDGRTRYRDLTSKYHVVRRALLRLEKKGETVRAEPPPRQHGGPAQRAYWGADGWTLKEREKTERRQKQAQIGLRVV